MTMGSNHFSHIQVYSFSLLVEDWYSNYYGYFFRAGTQSVRGERESYVVYTNFKPQNKGFELQWQIPNTYAHISLIVHIPSFLDINLPNFLTITFYYLSLST